jgi:hypothetical protein
MCGVDAPVFSAGSAGLLVEENRMNTNGHMRWRFLLGCADRALDWLLAAGLWTILCQPENRPLSPSSAQSLMQRLGFGSLAWKSRTCAPAKPERSASEISGLGCIKLPLTRIRAKYIL